MGIKRAGRDFVFFYSLLLLLLSPFLFNPIWAQTSVGPILTLCSIVCAPISRIKKLAFLAMSINFQIFMRCFAQHHLFRVFVNNNKSDTSISRIVYEGRAHVFQEETRRFALCEPQWRESIRSFWGTTAIPLAALPWETSFAALTQRQLAVKLCV